MKNTASSSGITFVLLLIGVGVASRVEIQAAPQASGWINIMPDSSFHNWTRIPIPPNRPLSPHSQWSADATDHTVICAGDGGHEWLRCGRTLGDFLFRAEWRLARREGEKGYNSGVFVRNNRDGSIWYEAQVSNASGGYWFGYDNPAENGPIGFNLKS